MKTVNSISAALLEAGAVAFRARLDGMYDVYFDGDDVPIQSEITNVAPVEVTMRQARLALHAAGKLAAVNAAIAALPDPPKTAAQIEWEYSNTVRRDSRFVSMLGPALGLDSAALDALFIAASKLES